MRQFPTSPVAKVVAVAALACAVELVDLDGGRNSSAYAQLLEGARREVRDAPASAPAVKSKERAASRSHGHDSYCDDDDGDILGELLCDLIVGAFTHRNHCNDIRYHYDDASGQWLSHDYGPAVPVMEMYFSRYPYADDWTGSMMHETWVPARPRVAVGRLSLEYGSDFDALQRWGAKALVENQKGWGLDADWHLYFEQLPNGRTDDLHLGDVNVLYRLIEAQRSQWRLGLGMNWLGDSGRADFGFNTTAKVDFYPHRPLIVSGEVDYGWLGGAEMFHGSVTVGAIWDRVEFFGGYDYRKIGSVELEGPLIGLRLWF